MIGKIIKTTFWLVVLTPVLLFAYCKYQTIPPKDDWYFDNFSAHQDDFLFLVQELCRSDADIAIRVNREYKPSLGISEPSFVSVQKSLERIGADQVQKIEGCHIKLSIWSIGFAGEGDYKDYTRAPMVHDRVEVSSLDNLYEDYGPITEPSFYMRPIKKEWFITYDVWP